MDSVYNITENKTWTIEEIYSYINKFSTMIESFGKTPAPVIQVDISKRLKKALAYTRRRCYNNKDFVFSMVFNYDFLKVASTHNIETVILHECIHLVENCFDHGTTFKTIANRFIDYGYHVERTLHDTNYSKLRSETTKEKIRYVPRCRECGATFKGYLSMSPTVKTILSGKKGFYCNKCKSTKLIIDKIYPNGLSEELHSIRF